ncbi:MAG: DUF2723 domain-containing protein [Anaerolineae bacterium]|nr:DUF2723 domain-containing protein [Anaerolineae bacterium]
MRNFPAPWLDLARHRPVRQAGAALLAALYALRVALEFALPPVVRPDDALPLVLLAAVLGGAAGFGLARASGVAWPALLLLIYALYPAISPEAAGVACVLALAAWLAARALPNGWAWDMAVLLVALAVYVGAAAPGVLPADAGEFQLVVNELGVAHPPGYPLYTLVGWGFAQLPLGSPAYRVNLFSALTAALTLAVVSHAVRRETRAPVAGLAAALAHGAATSFWLTATQASIRPMAALFTALALDALLAYRRAKRPPHPGGPEAPGSQAAQGAGRENRILARFALCVGLGLTHHASLVFVVAVFVAALVAADRALLRQPRRWLRPGLAFAAGFLPWLYLPLRAGAVLAPADINTWDGFWNHVLARGFEGDLFVFAPLARLPVMGEVLTYQWHGLVLAAGAAAALLMLWRDRWLLATLGGAFALHTLVTATYRAPQTVEYMTPAYVCLAAAVGWVVGALASRKLGAVVAPRELEAPWELRESTLVGAVHAYVTPLVAAVVILGGALTFAANLPSLLYLHADEEARDFATRLLDATPDGAVLLANWHRVTPLWYLQGAEGQRPDVEAVYVYPDGAEPLSATWARRIGVYLEAGRPVVVQSYFPTPTPRQATGSRRRSAGRAGWRMPRRAARCRRASRPWSRPCRSRAASRCGARRPSTRRVAMRRRR